MKKTIKNRLVILLAVCLLVLGTLYCVLGVFNANGANAEYKKFYTASDGVTVEYKQKNDLLYSDLGDGVKVVMKDYTEISFNKTIDLNGENSKDSFLDFYVVPSVDGQADFSEMFVYLYDINDSANYVKIRLKNATTVVYTQAGANGNSLKGKAHWDNKIYTDGIWGGAEEASFSGYYKSGDRRLVKLRFDNELMQYFMNGRYIVDLDDPEFYAYSQHFKGFSSGQVQVKLVVNGTNKQRAELVITKLGDLSGEALNITEIVDTEAPVITVDKSRYGVSDFPNPVIGGSYPLFDYSACDVEYGICPVEVSVVRNGSENIAVSNGSFTVDKGGEYTIKYTSFDDLGNEAEIAKTFVASADKVTIGVDIETDKIVKTMSLGEKLVLPEILNVSGAIGNFTTSIQAISKSKSYVVNDGVFVPEEAGTYSIVFGAKDILNRFGNTIYEIEVVVSDRAIFTETPNLPKYFIEGFNYIIPTINAFNFATNSAVDVSIAVSVDDGAATTLGADRKIKLSSANEKSAVKITYTADGQTVSYERPMFKVRDNLNQINMYKYFNGNGITVSANDDYTILTTANGGSAEFINTLLASDLNVVFKPVQGSINFRYLTFTFTDSINTEEKVSLRFENTGSKTIMSLVNSSVELSSKIEDLTSDVNLVFNKKVTVGDKNLMILTYDNGEEYKGFSTGVVYMSVSIGGVFGQSAIAIKSINNQIMGTKTVRDNIKPRVVISGDIGGMYDKGAIVTTQVGFAADVISPELNFTLKVEDPNGNAVYDLNGVKLDGVSPYVNYQFALTEKGDYKVYYTAVDSSTRSSSSMYIIRSYVKQYISLDTELKTLKAGNTLQIPNAILNNVENVEEYRILVVLYDTNGLMTSCDVNQKIKLENKGTYRLVYIASNSDTVGKIDPATSIIGSFVVTVE